MIQYNMQTFDAAPMNSSQPILKDNFEYIFGENLTNSNEGKLV